MSEIRNPRIMGVVTADGEKIKFNRQRDSIVWQADTLHVTSPTDTRAFSADAIRAVLVDRTGIIRIVAVFAIPVALAVWIWIELHGYQP